MRDVILVHDTSSWSVLHNCEVSWLYSKRFSFSKTRCLGLDLEPNWVSFWGFSFLLFQVMERTRNCIWNHQGKINKKVWKRELPFLYATHCHDLHYVAVKYHDYIPKGIQVIERTRNRIWNDKGEITQKIWQRELPFLYAKYGHDLIYITIKYHQNIPNGFQVMERTQNCNWNNQV